MNDETNVVVYHARKGKRQASDHANDFHGEADAYSCTNGAVLMEQSKHWEDVKHIWLRVCKPGRSPRRMSIVSTVVMIVTAETPWYICQMKQSCCEKWNRGVNSVPINKMDLKEGSNIIHSPLEWGDRHARFDR